MNQFPFIQFTMPIFIAPPILLPFDKEHRMIAENKKKKLSWIFYFIVIRKRFRSTEFGFEKKENLHRDRMWKGI